MYKVIKDLTDGYVAAKKDEDGTIKCTDDVDPIDYDVLPLEIIAKLVNKDTARCYNPETIREAAAYDARDPIDRSELPVAMMVYLDRSDPKPVPVPPVRYRPPRDDVRRLQSMFEESMNDA